MMSRPTVASKVHSKLCKGFLAPFPPQSLGSTVFRIAPLFTEPQLHQYVSAKHLLVV
jgi:hypothetical protein